MPNYLSNLDRSLFYAINGAHNPASDSCMVLVTRLGDARVLAPLILLLFLIKWKKQAWPYLLLIGVTVLLSDSAAHHIKPFIGRIRPSHALPNVHLVLGEGGRYGFPSNHATNAFAMATTLSFLWRRWSTMFFTLAGVVAYSRIYIGVHYPGDVLGGAILGSLIAWIILLLYGGLAKRYKGGHPSWPKTTAL